MRGQRLKSSVSGTAIDTGLCCFHTATLKQDVEHLKYSLVKTINVPISLVKMLRQDKVATEMLACAIMIKRRYQHSVLYGVCEEKIMSLFGVATKKKAAKLLDAFKKSDLFVYNAKKRTLYAKSFKSKEKVIYGKNGKNKYEASADFCRKIKISDNVVLREVVRELRYTLVLSVINAVERSIGGNLNSANEGMQSVTKLLRLAALPQRLIGEAIGMSRATAARLLQELINDGRVSKTQIVAECVIECLNEETERVWREANPKKKFYVWHDVVRGGWSGWVMYGYAYSIKNLKDSNAFQHVIWNYDVSRRKKKNDNMQPTCSSELDGNFGGRTF